MDDKVRRANTGQDEWKHDILGLAPELVRSEEGQRGSQHEKKLVVGAPVVANFSLYGDAHVRDPAHA